MEWLACARCVCSKPPNGPWLMAASWNQSGSKPLMEHTFKGARVLITGGAGFVGSHIADQLLACGAEHIRIIDNFVRGRWENLEHAQASGRVSITVGDICDAELVDQLTEGVDYVFHQAALRITQCAEEPVTAMRVMVGGTQNVLESAVRHKVKK